MEKLHLFNSLHKEKEEFKPLDEDEVTIYTCGPTVYDRPHIGNLRAYVFSDVLIRTLQCNGYNTKQVMNITDVGHLTDDADSGEDKVELKAEKENKSAWDISEQHAKEFKKDIKDLNIIKPSIWAKVTDHIEEQIDLVKTLEEKGYTYETSDGIYFNTKKFSDYGEMSNLQEQDLEAGARVDFNEEKKNIHDFALWKFSPEDKDRQMEWESPWGTGFPGWHIECSTLAMCYLGDTIDIHTGGTDHLSIHHPNEIAQSEAATGQQFVRYWLHCAFLTLKEGKMSKSEGTTYTIDDLEEKGYEPLVLRYMFLTARYRSLMEFSWESLESAENSLNSLRDHAKTLARADKYNRENKIKDKVKNIINDDLDTPQLLASVWNVVRSDKSPSYKKSYLLKADNILGLGIKEVIKKSSDNEIPKEIKQLAEKRESLRKEDKWDEADKLRDKIKDKGYKIKDKEDGYQLIEKSS